MPDVFLNRIVTRVPAHEMHAKFLALIPHLVDDERDRKLFQRLAAKAQIGSRYSVLAPVVSAERFDDEWFYVPGRFPSTARRMALFEREAPELVEPALRELFDRCAPKSVTHLVLSSCTGFSAPGLDLELLWRLGLRSDLERTVIGFMGCSAAINALRCAYGIVRSHPAAKVLVVNVELCTLHFQEPTVGSKADFEQLLSYLQFADGCAVSLVSAEPVGLRLDAFKSAVLPDTDELIQWRIGDFGFRMRLALELPTAIGAQLPTLLSHVLTAEERRETALWAIHPGGRAILDMVQDKIGLSDEELWPSREILHRYGNMSAATVMFVLRTLLEESRFSGLGLAVAFGPGVVMETMKFHKVAR